MLKHSTNYSYRYFLRRLRENVIGALVLVALSATTVACDMGSESLSCTENDPVRPGLVCYKGVWINNPDACVANLERKWCHTTTEYKCGKFQQSCGEKKGEEEPPTVTINCGECPGKLTCGKTKKNTCG